MTVDQRYRFIYKPLVFAACLVPLLWLALGAFGLFGVDLGADPIKTLLHACGKTALQLPVAHFARHPGSAAHGHHASHPPAPHAGSVCVLLRRAALHHLLRARSRASTSPPILADIAKRPYITVGFAALVLLIPLAITSTNNMMRRLGSRWQKLHRLVYLIAALGVLHYYWQVKRDVREPLIYAAYWRCCWAIGYVEARARATSKSVSATAPERT